MFSEHGLNAPSAYSILHAFHYSNRCLVSCNAGKCHVDENYEEINVNSSTTGYSQEISLSFGYRWIMEKYLTLTIITVCSMLSFIGEGDIKALIYCNPS